MSESITSLLKAINAEREYALRDKDTDLVTPLETKLWRDLCKKVDILLLTIDEFDLDTVLHNFM